MGVLLVKEGSSPRPPPTSATLVLQNVRIGGNGVKGTRHPSVLLLTALS